MPVIVTSYTKRSVKLRIKHAHLSGFFFLSLIRWSSYLGCGRLTRYFTECFSADATKDSLSIVYDEVGFAEFSKYSMQFQISEANSRLKVSISLENSVTSALFKVINELSLKI